MFGSLPIWKVAVGGFGVYFLGLISPTEWICAFALAIAMVTPVLGWWLRKREAKASRQRIHAADRS